VSKKLLTDTSMPTFNATVLFTIHVRADYACMTNSEQSAREHVAAMAKEDARSMELAIEMASATDELITDACDVEEVRIDIEHFVERDEVTK
jgi:hypothetical protein